jgi:hypothetical protein
LNAATNASTPEQDRFMSSSSDFAFGEFIRADSLSAPDANLHQTDGTTDEIVLFPVMLIAAESTGGNPFFPGEIDDVFWISAFGGVLAEDRIIKDGEVYRIFPNCNRTNVWEFLAIKEVA